MERGVELDALAKGRLVSLAPSVEETVRMRQPKAVIGDLGPFAVDQFTADIADMAKAHAGCLGEIRDTPCPPLPCRSALVLALHCPFVSKAGGRDHDSVSRQQKARLQTARSACEPSMFSHRSRISRDKPDDVASCARRPVAAVITMR